MDAKKPEPKSKPPIYARRQILGFSWKLLGIGLAAEAAWTSYDILAPKHSGAFGGLVDAGPVADFKTGAPPKYFLDGRFYLSRYTAGSSDVLVALYQKCPHLGCRVPFCDSSKQFECPCHGSVFNAAGEYIKGPTPRGMDQFKVTEQNGHVMVDTGSVVEGPARGVLNGPGQAAGPSCVGESSAAPATPSGSSASPGASPSASGSP
jgi:cytochrome b6-f complex iron-sulfur subunit